MKRLAQQNIILVGPMASGKTTIGQQLARQCKLEFFDSDREVEKRTGASISLIFDLEGEEGFRQREVKMIDELTSNTSIVLATGGGAVAHEENRKNLRTRGFVIYLQASVEQLYQRTHRDRKRPLLQTEDRRARIAALLAEREPMYQEVADLIVNTDHRTVHQVVKEICQNQDLPCTPSR